MDVVSYWYMISDKARETLGPPASVPTLRRTLTILT